MEFLDTIVQFEDGKKEELALVEIKANPNLLKNTLRRNGTNTIRLHDTNEMC